MVTRDGALNHLVGRDFSVGPVRLSGLLLSEPCNHLAKLTMPEISNALVHRGGLRCQILSDGFVRVGDAISA
jgi:MOSC domain-containing protein YiiM